VDSIVDKINAFRVSNGVAPIRYFDRLESDHCLAHALYMAGLDEPCHTPDYFLNGKGEAVGAHSCINSVVDTVGHIIFEQFGKSDKGHREILLNNNIAYGVYTCNSMVYFVVRSW